jgi:hypothetical protein
VQGKTALAEIVCLILAKAGNLFVINPLAKANGNFVRSTNI